MSQRDSWVGGAPSSGTPVGRAKLWEPECFLCPQNKQLHGETDGGERSAATCLCRLSFIVIQGQTSVKSSCTHRSDLGSAATLTSDKKIHGQLVPAS